MLFTIFVSGCSLLEQQNNELDGIHIPDTYNNIEGKNRILYSIKSTAFGQWEWFAANGLLGVSMLNIELDDRIGYETLFKSIFPTATSKMQANNTIWSNLLMEVDWKPLNTKSIIARRESIIYTLAYQLESRYIYNDMWNSQRIYTPQKNRKSNEKLKNVIIEGEKVYNELFQKWFNDITLRDSLCIGYASLVYDGIEETPNMYGLWSPQICLDALKSTVDFLNKYRNDEFVTRYGFLYTLGEQMRKRNLTTDDVILAPNLEWDTKIQTIVENTNENELELKLSEYISEKQDPILKIISEDLDNIIKK